MPTPLDATVEYTSPMLIIPEKGTTNIKYRSAPGTMNISYIEFLRQNLVSFKWNES